MDESGPSHKKKFTVKLVLQEGEEYEGSGASIKKAQQAAAEVALEKTALSKPPKKCKKEKPGNIYLPVYCFGFRVYYSISTVQCHKSVGYRSEDRAQAGAKEALGGGNGT